MQCSEKFLNDVVRVRVYRTEDMQLSLPGTIPFIRSMEDVLLPEVALLDVGYSSSPCIAVDNSINVKQSVKPKGGRSLYIYNVETLLEHGTDMVMSIIDKYDDCHVVITTADEKNYLLYSLPNTFAMDINGDLHEMKVSVNLNSMNDIIAI